MEFIGHAGAGPRGQDPVCAALSILMYTLIDCVPGAKISSGDGYCRVDGPVREKAAYEFARRGAALLEGSYPRHVHLEVKR